MEIFNLTLTQMLTMFTLILVGFLLRKKLILPENAHVTMSRLETYVLVPGLMLFNQMTQCTVDTFRENAPLILYGLILTGVLLLLSYPLSKLFVRNYASSPELSYRREIFKYALTFGNFGFMGNYIVLGVWGSDVFYQYSLFTFFMNLLSVGWGMYVLIPKEQNVNRWVNLCKGLLTPPIIAMVIGMVLGLLNARQYMPDFLLTAMDNAGACQGPIAMVLAGFVIGGYNFKELLSNRKVYIITALRLLVIPAAVMCVLKLLGTPEYIMSLALIAFATPIGLNTIVYPAAYGGETKTGASMAMVSHTLSVVTIPLMYLLFIVLL